MKLVTERESSTSFTVKITYEDIIGMAETRLTTTGKPEAIEAQRHMLNPDDVEVTDSEGNQIRHGEILFLRWGGDQSGTRDSEVEI